MSLTPVSHRPFTGRHMALIMVLFFAVVVGVNLTMAMLARQSWTGLVVQNSYVASQQFNGDLAKREAFLARGYQLAVSYKDGRITFAATDKFKQPLPVSGATLRFNRDPNAAPLDFVCERGSCASAFKLSPGLWSGDLKITLSGQESWPQAIEILVKEE